MSDDFIAWNEILGEKEYLSGDDFDIDERRTFTIKSASHVDVKNPQTNKSSNKVVVHFEEPVKAMIFNKTNARAVHRMARTRNILEWPGVRISVYFDPDVMFGKQRVGGLRVDDIPPPPAPTCSDCQGAIKSTSKNTSDQVAVLTAKRYGKPVCAECAAKREAKHEVNEG